MHRSITTTCLSLLLVGGAQRATAFSMLGPFSAWQTADLGYQLGADIGGPMNLGEEYRWGIPYVTYGFDESFLNYYGSYGAQQVDEAMQMLNSLPSFSSMSADLSEFPPITRRVNYTAEALGLLDLKSWALSIVIEELGLGAPERWVWTLRARQDPGTPPPPQLAFTVIQRNFDPVSFEPTSYINGILYTYEIQQTSVTPLVWEAVDLSTDPTLVAVTTVASMSGIHDGTVGAPGAVVNVTAGTFFTGLTRDDVGGLRYLYRTANMNVETLPAGAAGAPAGTSEGIAGLGQPSNPWLNPGQTNQATNAITVTNVVLTALRTGVDKLNIVRVDFDSGVGGWAPVTNVWTDVVITNGVAVEQTVQRILTRPDILFGAADLGILAGVPAVYPVLNTLTANPYQNNDALNGFTTLDGPGAVVSPIDVSFSKIGRALININPDLNEDNAILNTYWGSFDGTTNQPVVYPSGVSVQDLEQAVLSGVADAGRNPWLAPPVAQSGGGQTPAPLPATGGGTTP